MKRGGFLLILILLMFQQVLPVAAADTEERKWQDESIYYLMVDRFNNGSQTNDYHIDMHDPKAFHGGDFQGIIEQLDYIKGMGVTILALTPIFANEEGGYHGFWVNDFYQTEEHFGTLEEFKTLVNEVHKRDMKLLLDFDVLHVGDEHPWLGEADKEGWLLTKEGDELPRLNLEHPDTKQYMIEAANWWVSETGIDGYRLHSVQEAPAHFWHDFSAELRKNSPDIYLLGDSAPLSEEVKGLFDGWMNNSMNEVLKTVFVQPDISFQPLFSFFDREGEGAYAMVKFMDNEKIVRFTNDLIKKNEHPGPRWKQALTFLYTTPGVPFVYYGSEIALDGGEGEKNHAQMNFRTDKEIYDYAAKLGELRHRYPSLTKGTLEVLYEKDGAAVYKRVYEDETTVVAINNTTKTQTITLPAAQLEDEKELRGVLNGDLVRSAEQEYILTIDRDMSEIYVLSEKSSINISYILAMTAVLLAFTLFMFLVWRKSKENENK